MKSANAKPCPLYCVARVGYRKIRRSIRQTRKSAYALARKLWNAYQVRDSTKYFCIGRNKTGTTSLKRAFIELGFIVGDQRHYHAYQAAMKDLPGIKLISYPESERNNYQYVFAEAKARNVRDRIVDDLRAHGVMARKYFWSGVHLMEPYRTLYPGLSDRLPNTGIVADRTLVLPTGQFVDRAVIEMVVERIDYVSTQNRLNA